MQKAKTFDLKKITYFLNHDIWLIQEQKMGFWKRFLIKQLKIMLIAYRGFVKDRCIIRASALTYFTLLSIVPVAALFFGIAKGFGIQQKIESILTEKFANHKEILDYVLEFSNKLLDSTKGGLVAGVGIVILLWSVMKLLNSVEKSFNDIWKIKTSRSFIRKFSDYFSLLFIAPILILLSSSLTVYITTQLTTIIQNIEYLGFLSPVIFFLLKLTPYIVIWLVLTLVYMIMPNTSVNLKSAIIAGIIAGTIFQLTQWGYFKFQIGMANYNAIYGSFAALPLFLIWIQLSWLIVLFGAEISFANQNVYKYEFETEAFNISDNFKKKITILIMYKIIERFKNNEKPLTSPEISSNLEIPVRIVRQIIFELVSSNILSEVKTEEEKVSTYQPAVDINILTIGYMVDSLNSSGNDNINMSKNVNFKKIEELFSNFNQKLKNSEENILIKDI